MAEPTEGGAPDGFDDMASGELRGLFQQLPSEVDVKLGYFEDERSVLYDELSELAARASETREAGKKVEIPDHERMSEAYAELVCGILASGADIDTKIDQIVDITKRDTDERVNLMNALTGCKDTCLPHWSQEKLRTGIMDAIVSDVDPANTISGEYAEDLEQTTSVYVAHLNGEAECGEYKVEPGIYDEAGEREHMHDDAAQGVAVIDIRKDWKDHAADVAKIAAGVFIALAADKLIHREKGQ